MSKWKKPKGREHRWNRSALIRRDGLVCKLCGKNIEQMKDVTVDHIVPISLGGYRCNR